MSKPQAQPAHADDESADDSVVHLPLDAFPLPPKRAKRGPKKSRSDSDLSLVGHALLAAIAEGASKRAEIMQHPAVKASGASVGGVGYYLTDLCKRRLATVKGRSTGAVWKLSAGGKEVASTKLSPAERKQRDRANKKRWYDENKSAAARAHKAGTEVAQLGPRGRQVFDATPVIVPVATGAPVDIEIAFGAGGMQFTAAGFRITVRKLREGET